MLSFGNLRSRHLLLWGLIILHRKNSCGKGLACVVQYFMRKKIYFIRFCLEKVKFQILNLKYPKCHLLAVPKKKGLPSEINNIFINSATRPFILFLPQMWLLHSNNSNHLPMILMEFKHLRPKILEKYFFLTLKLIVLF